MSHISVKFWTVDTLAKNLVVFDAGDQTRDKCLQISAIEILESPRYTYKGYYNYHTHARSRNLHTPYIHTTEYICKNTVYIEYYIQNTVRK